jgi:hypothetical protein
MLASPFDVQPIIARLVAQVPAPTLRQVQGAAEYATVQKLANFAPPCAYVIMPREKAQPHVPGNAMPGQQQRMVQKVTVTFGVIVVVQNYRDQLGAQSQDSLNAVLGAVRGALLGWVPPGASQPISFQQGDLLEYDAGRSLWADVYQTNHVIGVDP